MVTCNYCGEDFTVVYTCKLCRGKFCKDHKHPDDHDCSSKKSGSKENIEPNIDKSIESSIKLLNKESEYDKSNTLLVRVRAYVEDILNGQKENVLSENIKFKEPSITPETENKYNEPYEVNLTDSDSNGIISKTPSDSMTLKPDNKNSGLFRLSIVLSLLLVISLGLSGSLYFKFLDYQNLQDNYQVLYYNTITIQSFYDELSDQYFELREEYSQLNEFYSDTLSSYHQLQAEYDDLINYELNMEIEESKTITLGPKQNSSLIYQIPFSGYIDVYYNSSGAAYVWVGSTTLTEFYSRNPQFPGTASELNFTIPVLPDVIIYFANPDEFDTITLTYNLVFTY